MPDLADYLLSNPKKNCTKLFSNFMFQLVLDDQLNFESVLSDRGQLEKLIQLCGGTVTKEFETLAAG